MHEDLREVSGAMLTDRPIAMAMIPSSIVAGLELGRQGLSYQDSINDAVEPTRREIQEQRRLVRELRRLLRDKEIEIASAPAGRALAHNDLRSEMRERFDSFASSDQPQWLNPNWLNEYSYRPREESQE